MDKAYCFKCLFYEISYPRSVLINTRYLCNKNLDYVTGNPKLCRDINKEGDCKDFEEELDDLT